MSNPSRRTIGDSADRSAGRSERDRDDHKHSSQRTSKDESASEMRERSRDDYNKGDMRTGGLVSQSHRSSGHVSRDKDQGVRRSDTSGRDDGERTGSSSSRSSKDYDHRERDKGKEKPLPIPSVDNRDRTKDGHGERGTHHSSSSRPHNEPSKSQPAPPQESLINSKETREEYAARGDRKTADGTDGKRHRGNPSPPGDYVSPPPEGKPEGKEPDDVAMKVDEVLGDAEMENDYLEARRIQEGEEQVRKDRELAMQVQKIEDSKAENHRDEESDLDSGSDTDESVVTAQTAESPGITQRLYSMVAGNTSPPMTKEERRKAEMHQLKKAYKKLVAAYTESEQQLHRKEKEAQEWYAQGHKYYMECGSLQRRVEMMDHERKSLASELAHTKQQLSDAINLSEVRGKELKGAQVFLTKADSLSVSDVVQKVAALNEEIFQAGALLAETLVYEPAIESVEENTLRRQDIITKTRDTAYKVLGTYLTDLLATESMKPQEGSANQLLVQIVLLIALTRWCSSICRGWIPDDKETNAFLEELYDDIRRAEDQAVAGRWRSLTRAHLSISTAEWTKDVMWTINCVMDLAGWTTQTPDDLTQFEKRLSSIFKALRDVRKATGEDVTSADLEVFAAHRGEEYQPGLMEDSYGDDRAGASTNDGEKEKVVGPSGLGLRKVNIVKTPSGLERRLEYLSFPKVVLEKTVKEAIEPPPPPKPRKKKGEPGAGGIMGMMRLS
ncbi:hypothetical protein BKA70DRAFT_1321355 [Coprinopsis sp. MPI-PUGE-AT-0042]|nr:hypothetical protein BKA70DRAFT_1321355 [Coprinopsis sp. MPI-PUGE-AT-0042]